MSKRLKIIRFTTVPISLNILLKNQLAYLNKYFEIIAVSSPGQELIDVKNREKVDVFPITIKREISIFNDLVSLIRIYTFLKREKPDIIHSNTPKSSLLSMVAGKFSNVKIRIYTITGLRFEGEKSLKRYLLIFFEKVTCYFATHVICQSIGVLNKVQQEKITNKHLIILGNGNTNGVNTEHFNPALFSDKTRADFKSQLGLVKSDFVFTFIGRLNKDKGVNELLKAFLQLNKSYKQTKLLLIGPLDDAESSFNINTDDLKSIHFIGFQSDVRKYLSVTDFLVLPSYREGFPNVILEAGSMGVPVIMTRVNGYHEYIRDFNGLLAEIKDVESLYEAMRKSYLNCNKYDKSKCREYVIDHFDQKITHNIIKDFYQDFVHNV